KEMTRREKFLGVLASPALAGLLFLVGLVGLYSELSHPGAILPGVLGAICLVLALFAMSVLPVSGAGMGLLVLGALFFFLEIKLAAHGVLAVGGAVAIVLGAILLFPDRPGAPSGELATLVAGAGTTAPPLPPPPLWGPPPERGARRARAGALLGA